MQKNLDFGQRFAVSDLLIFLLIGGCLPSLEYKGDILKTATTLRCAWHSLLLVLNHSMAGCLLWRGCF